MHTTVLQLVWSSFRLGSLV